jgi:hypothetical protein
MSLINDALKRAKQVPAAPVPDLQFRAADPSMLVHGRSVRALWPVAIAGIALLGLVLAWQVSSRRNIPAASLGPITVESASSSTEPVAEPAKPVASQDPATAVAGLDRTAAKASVPVEQVSAASSPVKPTASLAAAGSPNQPANDSATNVGVATEPPPSPLKLQGIIYNPRRPSAVINGRTLFLGDHFRDFRVTSIGADSVTLVGAGQTNVLNLPE